MSLALHAPSSTLSGKIVAALIDVAKSSGVSETKLMRAANVPADVLAEGRLPSALAYRVLEAVLSETSEVALGLRSADAEGDAWFNPIHLVFTHSPTLRHAFEELDRCGRLLTDQSHLQRIEDEHTVTVRCTPPAASATAQRFAVEMQLGRLVRMIRAFSQHAPLRVNFAYPAPSYRNEYARFFHGSEWFQQPFNEIVFDAELMDRTSAHHDQDVHQAMRVIADRRMMALTNSLPLRQRILELLVKNAPGGRVKMSTVGRWLGMSERSLRRLLEEEGASFTEIARDARSILARKMLQDTRLTIQDVAWEAGFSSASAFHYAFKQWTGMTPLSFRARSLRTRPE